MAVKDLRSDLKTKQTTSIPCFSAKFDTRIKMSMKKKNIYIYKNVSAPRRTMAVRLTKSRCASCQHNFFFSKLARRISPKVKTARSLKTGLHRHLTCVLSTDT